MCEVPAFDWEVFRKLPNAELFARRAYYSLLQKLIRDVKLGNRNRTSENDLLSIESVITRSFHFTTSEIARWCESRDWNTPLIKSPEKTVPALKHYLPKYSYSDDVFTDEVQRVKVAEIIADISDRQRDDIAEYLWFKLTQYRTQKSYLLDL